MDENRVESVKSFNEEISTEIENIGNIENGGKRKKRNFQKIGTQEYGDSAKCKKEKSQQTSKKSKQKSVCCVCLAESTSTEFAKITDKDTKQIDYLTKLNTSVTDIEWQPSFHICLTCAELLETVFLFFNTCRKSDEIRRTQLLTKDIKTTRKRKAKSSVQSETKPKFDDSDDDHPLSDLLSAKVKTEEIKENMSLGIKEEAKLIKEEYGNSVDIFKEDALDASNDENCYVENDEPNDLSDEDDKLIAENETKIRRKEKTNGEAQKRRRGRKRKEGPIKIKKTYNKRMTYIFKCDTCAITCESSKLLVNHCVKEHGMNAMDVRPYQCDGCPQKFRNATGVHCHRRMHDERTYMCSYCGKGFITRNDMLVHEKYHENKREHSCDVCGKCFNTSKEVRQHKFIVHTDRSQWKHVCEVCGKRFPQKSNLLIHAKRHGGERTFQCQLCDKKFLEKVVLKRHLLSHSNMKEHLCTVCNKEYKWKRHLKVHMAKHHGIGVGEFKMPSQERKHKCHICPKAFMDKNKLKRHLYTHTGMKLFACPICDKRFNDDSYVRQHMKKAHGLSGTEDHQIPQVNVQSQENYMITEHMKWTDEMGLPQALIHSTSQLQPTQHSIPR